MLYDVFPLSLEILSLDRPIMKRRKRQAIHSLEARRKWIQSWLFCWEFLNEASATKSNGSPGSKHTSIFFICMKNFFLLIPEKIIQISQGSSTKLSSSWRITGCHYLVYSIGLHKYLLHNFFLLNIKFWLRRENVVRIYHRCEAVTIHIKGRTH